MIRSPLVRALLTSAALAAAIPLAGCNTDGVLPMSEKAAQPLSEKMVKEIESKNMDKDSPILVRLFKEESELEVWKQDRTGKYALLKTYPICRWSGELGPKTKEGDRQAPEGFYAITPGQMNPNSAYYLSFDLGYPNAFDRSYGRTGSQLMVHGDCSSRGCYSMTDEQIAEIYALGRDAFFGGEKSFQVQAYPFRMTAQNMARHRNNPNMAFWRMLKTGNDHFEVTKLEPKVNVCEKRYVFDAEAPAGSTRGLTFSASGKCPAFEVPNDIASAVKTKEQQDEQQFAELVRRGTPTAPVKTYADGGMNKVFVAAVKNNQIGVHPQDELFVQTAPGTIPDHVRPPNIPELAGSPALTGVAAAAPHPDEGVQATETAVAAAPVAATEPATKSNGSLFSGLFSSKNTTEKNPGPLDRMAHLIGLGGKDASGTAKAVPAQAKPAAKPTRLASHGAIRAKAESKLAKKPLDPKATDGQGPTQTAAAAPAAKPGAITASATPPAAPATAMAGSAPVVPTGNFDSRWSAFR